MSALHISNVRLVNPGRSVTTGDLLVRDGRIVATGEIPCDADTRDAQRIDGRGRLLTPGLIDVHTHGVMHSLYEHGARGLRAAARELGRFGVTTVLPTIIPRPTPEMFACLAEISAALADVREINAPGLHLEGPFMALGGAACPTLPGDLALLEIGRAHV